MANAGAGGLSTGGSAPSGGAGGSAPVSPAEPLLERVLPGATALVLDPTRERLYVAMGASAPDHANSVVVLDPVTATLLGGVDVGPHPNRLAISDDGSTLWVGIHDAASVQRIYISDDGLERGSEYLLPPGDVGSLAPTAGPMVVLPGTRTSLAVSLHVDDYSPSLVGVVLLDDGVPRPLRLPGHTGASRLTRGPDGYLIGFNNLHGGFGLYTITVSAYGLTQTEHANLISGFDTDIVYDRGLLFGTDGSVLQLADPEAPLLSARLPARGPIVPETALSVAWVLEGAESHAYPALLSLVSVNLLDRSVIDTTPLATEVLMPRHFTHGSGRRFAFIADTPDPASAGLSFESGVYLLEL
ncbi:MAG TPA: hypothetical protein VMG12_09040 [Polyangiaceae bacterium]|nr:hypothetical protein [Polyangiaceae bacterium]